MIHDIDRLLEGAVPRRAARPCYDLEAGRRYIADRLAARPTTPSPAAPPGGSVPVPASLWPQVQAGMLIDDAARDLKALSKGVIHEPDAGTWVNGLVTRWEPHGGLVFGCLFDLTGRPYHAQWWWQFAAGAGESLAAYCLYLHHVRAGELRDAEHWFHQAARLGEGAAPQPLQPTAPDVPGYPHLALLLAPPIPDATTLPSPDPALREALDGLPAAVDEMCGPFTLPTGDIAHQLQELATH
ncbi:hypothetical protein ABZW10_33965 [Kitasatospora sp. NPDC004723]|uniref:hypothetical protein n=1 Tax=Kitasatospora sp. NPDC004723 TaxID=3154288 RepID=UPI0033B87490